MVYFGALKNTMTMEDSMPKLIKIRDAERHKKNPFLSDEVLKLDTVKKTVIAGSTKKILVDTDTGEAEGMTMIHRYKEVDKTQFVKLFIQEVESLFDLSRSGLKVFGFVLQSMRINTDEIYISMPQLMAFCGYKQKNQAYKGLSELMANKIIAMSQNPNLWFVNPNIVFNGDRVAFVKEYRLSARKKIQSNQLILDEKTNGNSEG
jgi:hypothetical protein